MMIVIYKMLFAVSLVLLIDIKMVHAAVCAPSIAVGGVQKGLRSDKRGRVLSLSS